MMDCTWGAGDIDEGKGEFTPRFKPEYFLISPSQLIYTHLPEDPQWQLLKRPLKKEEQERLPFLRPAAFKYGLKLESHLGLVITAKRYVILNVKVPVGVSVDVALKQGKEMLSREMSLVQPDKNGYLIRALLPQEGEYVLTLFVQKKGDKEGKIAAVDYKVLALEGNGNEAVFPVVYTTFYEWLAALHEPLSGNLVAGTQNSFRVEVPNALAVQVRSTAGTFLLNKSGNYFSGVVWIGRGEVFVDAKFAEDPRFFNFLKYTAQ